MKIEGPEAHTSTLVGEVIVQLIVLCSLMCSYIR